jgi:predicted PurR-regulated permease PerM
MEQTKKQNTLIIIAVIAVTLIFVYLSRRVLLPFFVAFSLAYLLDPLVDRMEGWKISRTLSVVTLLFLSFLFCLGGVLLIFPLFRMQAENLTRNFPHYLERVQEWVRPFLEQVAGLDKAKIQEMFDQGFASFGELPLKIITGATTFLWNSLSGLFTVILVVANLVIIPVAMFYLLRDFDIIIAKLLNLIPPRLRDKTVDVVKEIDEVLGSFVRGQLMVALMMGVLYCIGLMICGTPMSLLIGMVSGLANLIPYLGLAIGFIPAALLTYLQTQEFLPILGVAGVFAVVQALEGMVITPRIVGDNIGLHPVAVIFAVLLGGELFGLVGIIIGVPAVAVINVLLKRGIVNYRQSPFFGKEPEELPTESEESSEEIK